MLPFARSCDAIAATAKKLEKTALVAAHLRSSLQSSPPSEAATAAIFLSGRPFPAYEEATLQVGGALLWRVIGELSGKSEHKLTEIYRRHGDAGSVAAEALPDRPESGLSLSGVQRAFYEIAAARGPAAKAFLLRGLLERATPLEAKYIVKIISGDLRIGLKESLVEEAIARAFEAPLGEVKRANMLLGDLGETLRLASAGKLAEARLRLFHPIDFMLASPVESSEEALSYFQNASVEDKYDGIRAQAHVSGGEVRIFSRTRDEITESFPELPRALGGLPKDAILDGEIVAWNSSGVVTAVEYGHGKRIGVLSDYTFAVWDGERLVNIGKAYSGLTDVEIAEMTQWFLAHKISEEGLRLEVEPRIVLEVAFNNMMRSTRHESGYALRFPRIVRLRPDKLPEDADTIETVKEIYERQHSPGSIW